MESHFTCEPLFEQTQPYGQGPFYMAFTCLSRLKHAKNSPEMNKLTMTA